MKITFLQAHCSILSDNESYEVGVKADLRRGQQLIDAGIAYEGWGSPPKPEINLSDLSDDELRAMAKEQGYKAVHFMKRETLLERLGE